MDAKGIVVASATVMMTFAVNADPVGYWNMVDNGSVSAQNFCTDSAASASDRVYWEDGNYLISGSTGYPSQIGNANRRNLTIDKDIYAYGIKYKSGSGGWGGTGKLSIGAGGYNGSGSWDRYFSLSMSGGIHLTADQTWNRVCAIAFSTTITTEDDVKWTITTSLGSGLGTIGCQVSKVNDLSKTDIIISGNERLGFSKADATLKARTLTMEGTTRLCYDQDNGEPVLGRKYAAQLILKNGIEPSIYHYTTNSPYTEKHASVIYDFDKITVAEKTVTFGSGWTYSVKDGGTQLLEVLEGATAKLVTMPTAGKLVVTGAGTVLLPAGVTKIDTDANFTGKVKLTGTQQYIADVSGFAGTLILGTNSVVALPAMSTWPVDFKVETADGAKLYLPYGSEVDETRILGTKNYEANARGISIEPAGEITLGTDESMAVIGDGFTSATSITLAGGKIWFPFSTTFASPITVTADSKIGCALNMTNLLTGAFTIGAKLSFNSDVVCVSNSDATKWPVGRVVLTGGGAVTSGSFNNAGGAVEIRGGNWNFAKLTTFSITPAGILTEITGGANVTLADGSDGSDNRVGVDLHPGSWEYPVQMLVTGGAELNVGTYRRVCLGNQNWMCSTYLVVSNATVRLNGVGEFDNGGMECKTLQNNTNDRCPMAVVKILKDGLLVTDRIFSHTCPTHTLDVSISLGVPYEEGNQLILDGGTYKLGPNFGFFKSPGVPYGGITQNQYANQLFSQASRCNDAYETSLHYTSEIRVTIGENGGTFDVSGAREGNASFTNTMLGCYIPLVEAQKARAGYAGMEYNPCRGPRWNMQGELKIKGNGSQEFVINGLDAAVLTNLTADGVAVKVISDSAAENFDTLSLGAHGGSLEIVGENPEVNVNLNVLENGVLDASLFNDDTVIFQNATFAANSALWVRKNGDGVSCAVFYGSDTISLPAKMYYYGDPGIDVGTVIATSYGIFDTSGTEWSRINTGSARYGVEVNDTTIKFVAPPPLPLMLLVR